MVFISNLSPDSVSTFGVPIDLQMVVTKPGVHRKEVHGVLLDACRGSCRPVGQLLREFTGPAVNNVDGRKTTHRSHETPCRVSPPPTHKLKVTKYVPSYRQSLWLPRYSTSPPNSSPFPLFFPLHQNKTHQVARLQRCRIPPRHDRRY